MARILCVDDEKASLEIIESTVQEAGHTTVGVRNVEAALNVLSRGKVDLIISDYRMPDVTGLEFVTELKERGTGVPLIMVTGYASIQHAVASIKAGAVDYITKPIRSEQLQLAVEQVLELTRLRKQNKQLREEVGQLRSSREIVGESPALERILDTLSTVAPTGATVLIQGESGTGKELLARSLHEMSPRSEEPFIAVNCAALPESLVESTLFGHEKGAFTGAIKQTKGAFERADGGTLLLDEISEMRLELQAKLLRALQEGEFERVGGTQSISVDVRVVATSNRDLNQEVEEKGFREDLYYRLAVVPILVPPLRERLEDVPVLVQHFVKQTLEKTGKEIQGVAPETMEMLQSHSWPGNVRELSHAVERAVILSEGPILKPEDFERARFGLAPARHGGPSASYERRKSSASNGSLSSPVFLDTLNLDEVEAILIERALIETDDNRTQAAKLLGISPRTLRSKLNNPG